MSTDMAHKKTFEVAECVVLSLENPYNSMD